MGRSEQEGSAASEERPQERSESSEAARSLEFGAQPLGAADGEPNNTTGNAADLARAGSDPGRGSADNPAENESGRPRLSGSFLGLGGAETLPIADTEEEDEADPEHEKKEEADAEHKKEEGGWIWSK